VTEPHPDLSWPADRRELRVTVRPPEVGAVTGDGRPIDSVELSYRCEPATAADSGVPPNGWAYAQVEVYERVEVAPDDVVPPRTLALVYDEDALNSPLGQVPDWVYALLREHEPPAIGELEASAEDAWRHAHEAEHELEVARTQLLHSASVASAAVDTATLSDGVRGALNLLHDEASTAVSRQLTMAYAIGLAEGEKKADLAERARGYIASPEAP
jgi:hypothetical protein